MKWYQLHLSTLLAVMLLASVFVWLNVRERDVYKNDLAIMAGIPGSDVHSRGWPLAFEWWALSDEWDRYTLALDAIFCLLILALAGAGIEWVTRHLRTGPRH